MGLMSVQVAPMHSVFSQMTKILPQTNHCYIYFLQTANISLSLSLIQKQYNQYQCHNSTLKCHSLQQESCIIQSKLQEKMSSAVLLQCLIFSKSRDEYCIILSKLQEEINHPITVLFTTQIIGMPQHCLLLFLLQFLIFSTDFFVRIHTFL